MKKILFLILLALIASLGFVACDSIKDDDDCPSGGYHIWYTSGGVDYEYSSDSDCSSHAYDREYKYYCYRGGKCYAYYTK